MADPLTDIINRKAEFAAQFQNTGNLDQRRRFAQDLSDAKQRNDERLATEFEEMQRADPRLMNAVTKRESEIMKQDLARRRFTWDQEKATRLENLNAKKFAFEQEQEKRLLDQAEIQIQKAQNDMQRQVLEENDTVLAEQDELELRQQFHPDSTEYKKGVLDIAVRRKNLNKDYRQAMLARSGFDDPDTALQQATAVVAANPGSRATGIPLPGGGKISISSPRNELSDDKLSSEIVRMGSIKDRAIDEEVRGLADERLRELQAIKASRAGKTAQPASTAAPSTAPETPPATTLPTTVATVWRQDAAGNRFEYNSETKQPTGKYIPAK